MDNTRRGAVRESSRRAGSVVGADLDEVVVGIVHIDGRGGAAGTCLDAGAKIIADALKRTPTFRSRNAEFRMQNAEY